MKIFWIAASVAVLSACVTTNIYFPEAAVEKAADKIIEDIWQPVVTPLKKEKK